MVLDVCLDSTSDAGAAARRDGADAPLGASEPRRAHRPGAGALRDRPGRRDPGAARASRRRARPSTRSTASRSAASPSATRAREREDVTHFAAELLPADRPRYLMGVGTPAGPASRDPRPGSTSSTACSPTHLAWQGTAFTSTGRVRVTRGPTALADVPLDAACDCSTCADVQPRVPASPLQVQRAARSAAPLDSQPAPLSRADGRGARAPSSAGRTRRSRSRSSTRSIVTSTAIVASARETRPRAHLERP